MIFQIQIEFEIMKTLNYDSLSIILDYLSDKECCILATSSKEFMKMFKSGYMKTLQINNRYPLLPYETSYDLMNRMFKHTRRLQFLSVYLITDPHLWMPHWTKKVYFVNCKFTTEINPSEIQYSTEYICIKNNSIETVKINYDKFPSLRQIDACDNLKIENIGKYKYRNLKNK